MSRTKLALAALSVTVSAFMAFAGPAMALDCTHTNQAGVIKCGQDNNRFVREDRLVDDGFRNDGFPFGAPVFASGFDDEFLVWCGDHWGVFDPDDGEVEC